MRLSVSRKKSVLKQLAMDWDWKCPYCGNEFGSSYSRKEVWQGWLRPTLEHIVPVAYGGDNDIDNLLAICQVCNTLKHDKMFRSYADIISFIDSGWRKKGFEVDPEPPLKGGKEATES